MPQNIKLYYTPTSCGAANFLTATIGNVKFDAETVDLASHKTKSGVDFYTINPKGNVPTVVFDDGSILNENVATLTYLADAGDAGLAPKEGSPGRYRYLNDLGFVSTELHQAYSPMFNPQLGDDARAAAMANIQRRIGKLEAMLDGGKKPYLNGSSLSAADIYAYIVLSWSGYVKVQLPPVAQAYFEGLAGNEHIQRAAAAMQAKQ